MKKQFFFASVLLLLSSVFVRAQADPPPAAPDYDPSGWKEYIFADDNVRFRLPAEPEREQEPVSADKHSSRVYTHQSFMIFQLRVGSWPAENTLESAAVISGARDGALNAVKELGPKVIKELEINVDGHAGRFVAVELSNGLLVRMKIFGVKNRLYVAAVMVEKGQRHGVNWENDFERSAMAFLDSIHLVSN